MNIKRGRGRPPGTTRAVMAERNGTAKKKRHLIPPGRNGNIPPDRTKTLDKHQRVAIIFMRAHAVPQEVIARAVGMSLVTLRKHASVELAHGLADARALMGRTLVQRALNPKLPGSTSALIHWLNVHGGPEWQAKYQHRHMHSGADGGAIQVDVDVSKLTPSQIIALMAEIAGAEAAGNPEQIEGGAGEAGGGEQLHGVVRAETGPEV